MPGNPSRQEGHDQGQTEYQLIHRGDVSDSVSLVLSEHYANRRPPKSLLVPSPLGDSMGDWLSQRRGGAVEVRVPMRGELAKLRTMADRNAEIHLIRGTRSRSLEKAAADDAARSWASTPSITSCASTCPRPSARRGWGHR